MRIPSLAPRSWVLVASIAVAAVVSGAWYLLSGTASSLEGYASDVIATCAAESYPPACYDREIPKLMDKGLSMEEAFAVTSLIQDRVDDYFFCHVLGHNLSAKETAKDPAAWTSVIARCPTGMCSNGCLHGAAQERFRRETMTEEEIEAALPELSSICRPETRSYTGLEKASCYHSLGHLTMYITGAKIERATAVCDEIANYKGEDYTKTCYEGAYMQIFQPLEPEDFGLVKDIAPTTSDEAERFCASYAGERRAACHRESWPLYRASLQEPAGLSAFCALAPSGSAMQRCYNAMFYVITPQFNFDEERIVTYCNALTEPWKGQCYANAASRAMETDYRLVDRAVSLCTRAEDAGVGDRCYSELLFYSSFNFHKDSPGFTSLCKALPGSWGERCFAGNVGRPPSQVQPVVGD